MWQDVYTRTLSGLAVALVVVLGAAVGGYIDVHRRAVGFVAAFLDGMLTFLVTMGVYARGKRLWRALLAGALVFVLPLIAFAAYFGR